MPEMRKDPIVDRWVIVAKARAQRPHDFVAPPPTRAPDVPCQFCEGNERHTPGEVLAYRNAGPADKPGWRLRVVPNKYPALEPHGEPDLHGEGLYASMPGLGVHEVIIESPRHQVATASLSVDQLAEVCRAYRDRFRELRLDQRLVHAIAFKNVGPGAGASLEHAHSQLIATPLLPATVAEELAGAAAYFAREGACVFCRLLQAERASGTRVVYDGPGFTAFCPYASRFPFETWIVPKTHASHYETIDAAGCGELAKALRSATGAIERGLQMPDYNYLVHSAPLHAEPSPSYHWHLEIVPRLTRTAGYELGTGYAINSVPPEEAAAFLRRTSEDH